MPLDELELLLDLVGLGLAVNFLEIEERWDSWVHEDVVASAHATEAEPERLCERTGLGEPEVVLGSQRLLQELSGVRVLEETLARGRGNVHRLTRWWRFRRCICFLPISMGW